MPAWNAWKQTYWIGIVLDAGGEQVDPEKTCGSSIVWKPNAHMAPATLTKSTGTYRTNLDRDFWTLGSSILAILPFYTPVSHIVGGRTAMLPVSPKVLKSGTPTDYMCFICVFSFCRIFSLCSFSYYFFILKWTTQKYRKSGFSVLRVTVHVLEMPHVARNRFSMNVFPCCGCLSGPADTAVPPPLA